MITAGTKVLSHYYSISDNCFYLGKVHIGAHVFIGMNTLIISSVSIGDRAVIGAGSVVTKDIPSCEVWAGNPARFLKNEMISSLDVDCNNKKISWMMKIVDK